MWNQCLLIGRILLRRVRHLLMQHWMTAQLIAVYFLLHFQKKPYLRRFKYNHSWASLNENLAAEER